MGAKPRPANPFKEAFSREAVEHIAENAKLALPQFDVESFYKAATAGLEARELKARVVHTARVLCEYLPSATIDESLAALVAIGARWQRAEHLSQPGFVAWPLLTAVELIGVASFDAGLDALRSLTHLFTAEFAIRPFIASDPARVWLHLAQWIESDSWHVRRLVSEGTRPRLPWGQGVPFLKQQPQRVIALLDQLIDDPHESVRRSVANNLNDIAKDHPRLVTQTANRWMSDADEPRRKLITHALRSLVKGGDPEALAVLGYAADVNVDVVDLQLSKQTVAVGDTLEFSCRVVSRERDDCPVVVDYLVEYVTKTGRTSHKVFKLKTYHLPGRSSQLLHKKHSFADRLIRVHHPGMHALSVQINGTSRARKTFKLVPSKST